MSGLFFFFFRVVRAGLARWLTAALACRVKVASGKVVFHYRTKVSAGPSCGDCGRKLAGIPHLRPKEYRAISKRQKVVTRAYGGSRCHGCVRDRVVRAFLLEEQKIVKAVIKQAAAQQRAAVKQ